ncbi:leucine-rich repeat-containing protein 49-like isoform X8 [Mytilus californianus]|uniref:leucine-rich repeat-containing protein 49-like isoform X8 n=1 Tax=Mytilus californianus TaxID=6549 RepID=UPI002247FB19|nr:leucine-rich repeat-containing protein 49-like isoform X8 [Mytilus californianus]
MYNKPRSRLTLTRETNIHTTNSLASLQIVPTVSSGNLQSSLFSRHTQKFDKSTVQPQDQVIFRPTQIVPSDVNMKRYTHQGTPDFALNQFAGSDQKPTEKVPIHYRSNKKQIVPAAALAHDLNAPPDIVQDVEDSGRTSRSSSHLSPNTQKAPAFLPGDRVIFAESPSAPGIPVVYRTPEERSSNPDRLNLDRRKLTVCPILEGEEQLRLLNYQHNMICKIQHLSSLKRLIFLDLYDNQIEEIAGLNALKSLRVLMLGKNRIRRIENLDTLFKLDVLDLHGNQISNIENLNHLSELRVLNLAGNHIIHVDNLSGMDSLAELNLRRNKIKTVVDVDNLPSLQRLFLSFNEISSFEDIACLGESTSLSEISLDGNPIAQEQYYKQIVLRHMQQLKQLDMKRVTEEERRIALVMARKDDEKKKDINKTQILKEKKRLAINNARRQWEVMQGNMINKSGKLSRTPDLYANHVGSIPNAELVSPDGADENMEVESINRTIMHGPPHFCKKVALVTSVYAVDNVFPTPCVDSARRIPGPLMSIFGELERKSRLRQSQSDEELSEKQCSRGNSRPSSSHSSTNIDLPDIPKERPRTSSNSRKVDGTKNLKETIIFGQGDNRTATDLSNLADLEGDTLTLYGTQSLEALDRNWGMQAAGAVTHIIFKFIDFEDIAKQLYKVRTKFPGVQTLTFSATNIRSYQQINALSSVRRFDNLIVENEGNPITKFTLWRSYVVFRLAHFALKKINDMEVTAGDIVNAEKLYGPVSHITTSQLPQSRLLSLVGEARRKQVLSITEDKSKKLLEGKLDKSQNDFVGRAGLTHQPVETVNVKQQCHWTIYSVEQNARRNFARSYVNEITKEAIFTDRKRNELLKQWPMIFHEMVYSSMSDMSDMQSYMKKCLEELEKS